MIRTARMYCNVLGFSGLPGLIKSKIFGSVTEFKVVREDCKHPFILRVPTSDIPTCKQVFIDLEYDFEVKEQPHVIVDAGANIGLASIYFANEYPEARILAIEPEQGNFSILEKNVSPYSNITPIHAALWHRNEEINLVDPGLGNWGFMTETKDSSEDSSAETRHTVPAMTIDKIMANYSLETIDILKIDIEGAEKEVFEDTSPWIGKVDSLIVELHERMKPGCDRSFYRGAIGFDDEWKQGENVYLSKGKCLKRRLS